MTGSRKRIYPNQIIIISVCTIVLISRILFPSMIFDNISLWILCIGIFSLLIPDIGDLIGRIKKFKKGDIEIEFISKVIQLAESTEKAEEELSLNDDLYEYSDIPENVKMRVEQNLNNPRAALITLAVEIESSLRVIAERYDISNRGKYFSPRSIINILEKKNKISKQTYNLFNEFWLVRNTAVHGRDFEPSQYELYKLVDIGIRILGLLQIKPVQS